MTTETSPIDKIETVRNALAMLLVMAFIATIPMFLFIVIPESNKEVITYMVGQLSGMALTALGFYFVNKVGQDALDAKRTENTGKFADAITATANAATPADTPIDVTVTNAADNPVPVEGQQ